MSKLELPIRAFVEDYVRRAFPKVDFGRGSAANDLVIKAFAALMQPMRHEIDVIKVNQSLSNWRYMRTEDLDQIVANWGRYRQNGGRSQGTVRLYFDKALEYQFSSLEFYTSDGLSFFLVAPITITATDLFQRRMSTSGEESRYFFDVNVRSSGVGSRFALPVGSIVGVRNTPPGIVAVEQLEDFAVTAPEESNFDLVNSLFKNIGLRNLISRSSIRAPLLDNFPGILDMFIAGSGHASMVRDLIDVQLPTGPVQMHAGGMTDIWLNTATLQRKQITLSYLPSSGRVKLVSALQSQEQELIFDFQRGVVTIDGFFQNPEVGAYEVDESISLTFDLQDVPVKTFIISRVDEYRNAIAEKDIIAGNDMMVLPGAAGYGNLSADIVGLNFRNADIVVGDNISIGGKHRRITRMSGRVIETSPAPVKVHDFLYIGSPAAPGDRTFALSDVHLHARVNDRLIVTTSAAASMYSVLALSTNQVTIGRVDAQVSVTANDPHATNTNLRVLTITGPAGSPPKHSLDLANVGYIYFGTDAGFDQGAYFKIVNVVPGVNSTTLEVIDPSNATSALPPDANLVLGLIGAMPTDTPIIIERDDDAYSAQASKFPVATTHTHYANELDAPLAFGTDTVPALGIGLVAGVGDVVIFFDVSVPSTALAASGADGSRFSVVVSQILSADEVRVQPALPFELPAGARYAVMRNSYPLVTAVTADSVDPINNDVTINSFPVGLGDGLGLIIKKGLQQYVVMSSTAGSVRTLKFKPPAYVRTLTFNAGGYIAPTVAAKGLLVKDAVGGYTGILYAFDNIARTWQVIPTTPADVFDTALNNVTIIGTTAAGTLSVPSTGPAPVGYETPVAGDLGSFVRQGSSTGVLQGFNTTLFEWYVKPLGDSDTFSDLTLTTFVDTGTGVVTPGHGAGMLASAPGPTGIAAGPVTLTLDKPIAFSSGDQIDFYSRFGSSGCNFDEQNLIVDPNPAYSPSSLFTSVVAGTDQVALLAGIDLGLLTVEKVNSNSLRLAEAVTPDVVRFPNAPGATQFNLSAPIAQGETVIGQIGIGRWAATGRCLLISGPSGTRLLPIAEPLSPDSIRLAVGNPAVIYPGQGYTWEVVDALHMPYWMVEPGAISQYRVYRTPTLGDLIHSGTAGIVSNLQPTYFSDTNADLQAVLVGQDLAAGNVELAIDSGDYASSIPFVIKRVVSTNTVELENANFTTAGNNVSYRILHRNGSRRMEKWIDGFVAPLASRDRIALFADPGSLLRNNTTDQWVAVITPSAAWDGSGAPGAPNFTMPRLKLADVEYSPDSLYLISRRLGAADNIAIVETSAAITTLGFVGGSPTTRAYAEITFTANPVPGDVITIGMSGVTHTFQFLTLLSSLIPGRIAVTIGANKEATCANLLAALVAQGYPADIFGKIELVFDKTAGHYGAIQATDAFDANGFTLPYGTQLRVMLRNTDRVDAAALTGMAQNTFNYYSGEFLDLPVVKMIAVEVLDASTREPVKAVEYTLAVDDPGLRYSAKERNTLVISDPTVAFKPLRITYVSDPTIGQVDAYVNEDDTRVLNANQLAKRMETIAVSIQVSVRSSLASNEIGSLLANFVNTRRSTLQLSKADIIKALYDNREISYVEIQSMRLDATYFALNGLITNYNDVSEVFGSETACYIAENMFVTKI